MNSQIAMSIEPVYPRIWHLRFENQYGVTATFMRLVQFAYSEIPDLQGKYFTLEQAMDAYAVEWGNFRYTQDWLGYLVEAADIRKFFNRFGEMGDLLKKEIALMNTLRGAIPPAMWRRGRFCVIATFRQSDFIHELAHAFYHLDRDYRVAMDRITRSLPWRKDLREALLAHGYPDTKADIYNEIQAYLATSKPTTFRRMFDIKKKIPPEYRQVLRDKVRSENRLLAAARKAEQPSGSRGVGRGL